MKVGSRGFFVSRKEALPMANQNEVLQALLSEEKVVSTDDLAEKLNTTKDTIRAQCSRLKGKGYVDGSTKEGWAITTEGREVLERQEKIPTTPEDVGADTKSKLDYYGKLAGVPPDLVLATSEIMLTGDPEDLEHAWEAMTQMDVPIGNRRRWFNLWRNYLKQGIPPQLKEKVSGALETEEGEEESTEVSRKDKGRDYIIADDVPVFVGEGQGDFSLKDAKDILGMRALRARVAGSTGSPPQGVSMQDILAIIDKINEGRGAGSPSKSYVVTQGEEGAEIQEVEAGKPLILNQVGGTKPGTTYLVDNEGQLKEMQPGEPIVIRQQAPPVPQAKTYVVRQTPEGIITEEYDPSHPIILNNPSPGDGMLPGGLPFPVFGGDGKPVYDAEGRPVYADIEPTMKWLKFQNEQRREDERHGSLMGIGKTVRENLGDGIMALKRAAEEAAGSSENKPASSPEQPVFECGDCHTRFTPPPGWAGGALKCPNRECEREYTKEELVG